MEQREARLLQERVGRKVWGYLVRVGAGVGELEPVELKPVFLNLFIVASLRGNRNFFL